MLEGTDHHTTSQYSSHQHSQQSNNPVFQNSTLQPSNPTARTLEPALNSRTSTHSDSHTIPTFRRCNTLARLNATPTLLELQHTPAYLRTQCQHTLERSAHPRNHTITLQHTTGTMKLNSTHHITKHQHTGHHTTRELNTPHNKTQAHRTPHHTGTQTLSPMLKHTT
jgi:hypothetical protein